MDIKNIKIEESTSKGKLNEQLEQVLLNKAVNENDISEICNVELAWGE